MKMDATQLRHIASLLERKEQLINQLAVVEKDLRDAGWAESTSGTSPGRHGKLKTSVIDQLKAAGPSGLTLTQLAQALSSTNQRISIWYSMTGRKISNIRRDGSRFYWTE